MRKKIVDNRIAIAEYPNHYEQEIQEIQDLSYPNIHFTEDCTFDPFPEELRDYLYFIRQNMECLCRKGLRH